MTVGSTTPETATTGAGLRAAVPVTVTPLKVAETVTFVAVLTEEVVTARLTLD